MSLGQSKVYLLNFIEDDIHVNHAIFGLKISVKIYNLYIRSEVFFLSSKWSWL